MATRPHEERDLLAEVARAAELADPVPAEVLEAARASLTWLRVDAELAELLAASENAPRSVRGSPPQTRPTRPEPRADPHYR